MAKEKSITPIKKGTASFELVGKVKVSDYTFKIDVESTKADSDWVYNHMNLSVDCGSCGAIYADVMSGYGTDRQNTLNVHGKKKNDAGKDVDDFTSRFTIDWEDRFDKDILETCGDMNFFTVGLVKEEGKVDYKKFLSPYDGIKYAEEHLEDGMIVNVKGNIKYSRYNDKVQAKKEINSLVLSKAEEKDFRATFVQSILLDADSIGKPDKETMTIPITAYVVDHISEHGGKVIKHIVKGKEKKGTMLPLVKVFDFKMDEDMEKVKKMLKTFKVKGKKLTQLTVDGFFTKGDLNTVSVTEADIPDDIMELIESGFIDKDEILGQIALKNGSKKPEIMMIKSPHVKFNTVKQNGVDVKVPSVDKTIDIYEEDDVNILMILASLVTTKKDKEDEVEDDKEPNDEDLEKALENDKDEDKEEDEDWLKDL